ncbi:MAG: DUF3368 domain-containing protein [Candidatus Edwardsbacteria bacterium]
MNQMLKLLPQQAGLKFKMYSLLADLILLDESDARKIAELYNLRKTGLLGVLIKAKRQGRIQSLKVYLEELRNIGFHLSEQVYNEALEAVSEK